MPKAERGTPKDIGNRIKAKGLQKLKFYCQMCQKQCRDQNGFKCHLTSDSHLQQMKIFSEHAHGMLDNLSKEFEKAYLDTLRQRHGTKRVNANNIYQEVIRDRHHIHMNATKWVTLTDFCQYLGRTGKCVVDETERGWYVQYIERDATILAREEALQRRLEAEQAAEVAETQRMELQRVEAAKALDRAGLGSSEATVLDRTDEAKIAVKLMANVAAAATRKGKATSTSLEWNDNEEDDEDEDNDLLQKDSEKAKAASSIKDLTTLGNGTATADQQTSARSEHDKKPPLTSKALLHQRDKEQSPTSRKRSKHDSEEKKTAVWKEYWLHRGIMVRIITKKLAQGKYYKRKAKVNQVMDDRFTAEVEVLPSNTGDDDAGGDIIRLDQDDLETVVPKGTGTMVRIVNGPGRGQRARVASLDKKQYIAALVVDKDDTTLERVDYEHFSMIAE